MNKLKGFFMATCILLSCSIRIFAQYSEVHCEKHPNSMQIVQIDNRKFSTIIHFKLTNNGSGWMNIGENSYLKDEETNKSYKLLNSINLPINSEGESRYMVFDLENQVHYFSLEFEKLPDAIKEFDMIEDTNNPNAFNFYGITFNKENKKGFVDIDKFIESTPVKEFGIYVKENNTIYYYKHLGLLISLYLTYNKSYGKYYASNIDIQNFTGKSLLFNPYAITAKTYIEKEKEYQDVEVLSFEQYNKKVKNRQAWDAALYGIAEGLAASGAGHSSSTTYFSEHGYTNSYASASGFVGNTYGYANASASSYSTAYGKSNTQSYNGAAAYAAQQNAVNNVNTYLDAQYKIKEQINEGYVKSNTLRNQTEYTGYFNIKHFNNNNMIINIPINGTTYAFHMNWRNE